jgi:hypothetical protein
VRRRRSDRTDGISATAFAFAAGGCAELAGVASRVGLGAVVDQGLGEHALDGGADSLDRVTGWAGRRVGGGRPARSDRLAIGP